MVNVFFFYLTGKKLHFGAVLEAVPSNAISGGDGEKTSEELKNTQK